MAPRRKRQPDYTGTPVPGPGRIPRPMRGPGGKPPPNYTGTPLPGRRPNMGRPQSSGRPGAGMPGSTRPGGATILGGTRPDNRPDQNSIDPWFLVQQQRDLGDAIFARDGVLRSIAQQQQLLGLRNEQTIRDLTRQFDRGAEDLARRRGITMRDLDRAAEDLQTQRNRAQLGYDRSTQDLGIQRERDMTKLIDSLGARGLTGSGLANRFRNDATQTFDIAAQRLLENLNLQNQDIGLQESRLGENRTQAMGDLDLAGLRLGEDRTRAFQGVDFDTLVANMGFNNAIQEAQLQFGQFQTNQLLDLNIHQSQNAAAAVSPQNGRPNGRPNRNPNRNSNGVPRNPGSPQMGR